LVAEAPGQLHLTTEAEMAACLLPRPAAAHKGTFGHAVVVGGSPGKSGAVVLAARAAVRTGAGLVTAAVPPALLELVDAGSVESMTHAIAGRSPAQTVLALLEDKDAVALGPGCGLEPKTVRMVRALVGGIELPLVLDADGLNAVVGHLELVAGRRAPAVLTPHPGEAARLLGTEVAKVQADRRRAARQLARLSGAVVVLKGHRTLIAGPPDMEGREEAPEGGETGELWINPTGNSGMASGGSGDVLTGVLVALLAQGYGAAPAARLATYGHGLAGDLAAEKAGPMALAASDLVEHLGAAWSRLGEGR
ncbi:MAG: NAD(P)H-hydrate dehydratase, partial [Holophagales bacterium]|nr:NAD(P)H-hydrate dehydratase [Holophagales bacterium]